MATIKKLILIGNDPKCGRCNAFKPTWDGKEFQAFAKGAEMIDAGMARFPKVYADWMKKAKALKVTVKAFPHLLVLDENGKLLASFNPSGTAKATIAMIKKLCPDCCVDGDCEVPVVPPVVPPTDNTVVCPTCKGTGRVAKKTTKR